jgi:hypothetical protein
MDENGLQFFNLIDQNAVGCWNSMLPYSPINQAVVAKHDEAMIFPADIKVESYTEFYIIQQCDRLMNCM